MARPVKELGPGGHRCAARALGGGRMTLGTGTPEWARGVVCLAAFTARGRPRAAAPLPTLRTESTAIVASQSQAAPHFRTQRLYTRGSAAAVRRHLSAPQGYPEAALPTGQPLTPKLNGLGYFPKKGAKSQPPKKSQNPPPSSCR